MSDDEDTPQFLTTIPATIQQHASPDEMAGWLSMSPSVAILSKELSNIRSTLGRILPLPDNLTPPERTRIANLAHAIRYQLQELINP